VLTKRISLNPNLNFSQITKTSLRGVVGELTKAIGMSIFIGGTSTLQWRERRLLL
jgi:hypothetical protein